MARTPTKPKNSRDPFGQFGPDPSRLRAVRDQPCTCLSSFSRLTFLYHDTAHTLTMPLAALSKNNPRHATRCAQETYSSSCTTGEFGCVYVVPSARSRCRPTRSPQSLGHDSRSVPISILWIHVVASATAPGLLRVRSMRHSNSPALVSSPVAAASIAYEQIMLAHPCFWVLV